MKGKTKIFYYIFLLGATALIVGMGVNLGLKASGYFNNESSKKVVDSKKNDETKDFNIEYLEESYEIKSKNGKVIVENTRFIPQIHSDKYTEQAEKIQASLLNIINLEWAKLNNTAADYSDTTSNGSKATLELKVIEQNDKYFTFVIDKDGTINEVPVSDRVGYSYSIERGELLDIEEITTDLESLTEICYRDLYNYLSNHSNSGDLDENWSNSVRQLMFSEGVWYLTSDGLSFTFPKYSLGPGYLGRISYTVEYNKISDILFEKFKK